MMHTSLWMRVFQFIINCWGRAGDCRGGFWMRGAAAASGLTLTAAFLLTPGSAVAAMNTGQEPVGGPMQAARAKAAAAEALQALHREEEWMMVSKFMPDIDKGAAPELETAGDVLRARRFPEEAVEYYLSAYRHGANKARVLNKLGVTELNLHHGEQARAYFRMVVKLDKNNAEAWNNLGAVDYMNGRYQQSVSDYHKALKINPGSSVFHSNLGTSLIGDKDFAGARKEFATALEIDPDFGTRSSEGGVSAHVLSAEDRAEFCMEMARVYASKGKIDLMLHSLNMAADSGMNISDAMIDDVVLAKYRRDPRVITMIVNAKAMKKTTLAAVAGLQPLPAETN